MRWVRVSKEILYYKQRNRERESGIMKEVTGLLKSIEN
jgi:hypothetical protein